MVMLQLILITSLLSPGVLTPKPLANLLSSSINGITVSYSFSNFGYEIVNIDGRRFLKFNTEDLGVLQDLGKPELPAWRDFIEVPYDAELNLEVVDIKTERLSLAEKGISEKIIPTLPPVPKIPGAKQEFVMDTKQYNTDEFYPKSFVQVTFAGEMRGHRLYTLEAFPVRYNPVKNEIEVVTDITVEVTFKGGDLGKTYRNLERLYSPYFEYGLSKKILNYGVFTSAKLNPSLPVVYLVVTPAEWVDSLQDLINWNRQKGYIVKVARIPNEIPAGDTINVRNYLQNAYLNWPTPPTFVVLVGDVDRIGYFTSTEADNPANDLKYEDLDTNESEYFPDVYLGRLSVANIAELGRVVRKTVRYEKVLWSQGTVWAKKAFFIASADGTYHGVAEGTHNYCMSLVRSHGMLADSVYAYYTSGSPTIITNAINNGRSLVTYSGHGSATGWADYNGLNYSVTDIYNNLNNNDMFVFVQTYACLSGSYTVGECFSEAWIRAPQKGAVASMASSVTSYWNEDDVLERRVFDELFDTGYVWIKGAINEGKLELYRYYSGGGRTKRYYQMYNLMGDPSVYVWTQEPNPLALNYPAVVPMGPSQVQVTVTLQSGGTPVVGALVSAFQKGTNVDTLFDAKYTDASGIATLNIAPTTPDTLWFTVTGYNLWPQQVYAMVQSAGPYVTYKTSYIQEISENNNGRINPGETIRLYVMLKNYGQDGASDVQATLSTSNTNVTITDSSAYYGNINPGDSTYGSDYFEFQVNYSVVDQEVIPFTITIMATEGSWSASFNYTVYAPILSYMRLQVIDDQGNNNGIVDPGETVTLRVYARNTGHEDAPDVLAKITCTDSRVTINSNNISMGNIPQNGSGYADFSVTFGNDIGIGEIIAFGLRLSTSNLVFLDDFNVFVGVSYYTTSLEGSDYLAWSYESPWVRRNDRAYDGAYSFGTGTYPNNMNASLYMPAFIATGQCTLSFYDWVDLEANYDYGYIEVSINGGSWTQLGDRRNGGIQNWQRVERVVSANPGDTIKIRFRATSDGSVAYNGWYIDSLKLGPVVFIPSLRYVGYEVEEVYGNGNGTQDPGELVDFYFILAGGLRGVNNVVGYLTSLDGNVDIYDSVSNYGDVAAVGTAQGDGFQVLIRPSATINALNFKLKVVGAGYSDSFDISIPVGRYVGPCAYGYRAFSDLSPYEGIRPTFSWIEIKNIGTMVASSGDDVYQVISLPFTFKFFGENKTSITISSNGWVGFGSYSNSHLTNSGIPNSSAPNDIIAIVWDDLNPNASGSGKVYYYYDAANHIFIVEYDSVYHYGSTSPSKAEVILYDPQYYPTPTGDGEIVIQYLITPAQTDFTCGIENSQGTDGIQYFFDGTYAPYADSIVAGRAIKFTTDTTGLVSGIEENRPFTVALLGVSRNPLKGEGYITFQVPSKMVVRVELIDVQGRVVKVLADGTFDRGTHRVKLDGSKLSGGIYFVRMKADKVDKVQKVMIVK
jgi:hypothetical protein